MKAGLLATIILGESPYLKDLVRHFNLLVLDNQGRITGFNTQFIQTSQKKEEFFLHQSFVRIFDSDEGKAHLQQAIRQAVSGQPSSIQFYQFDNRVSFQGVILPVYDRGHTPTSLIVLAKEETRLHIRQDEIETFWQRAQKMIEEAGIVIEGQQVSHHDSEDKMKIILVEDKFGFMANLFASLLKTKNTNLVLAPNAEAALEWANTIQNQRIISTYFPKGSLEISDLAVAAKEKFQSNLLFLSSEDGEVRLEDGWLDIHVKLDITTPEKIVELISKIY